MFKLLFNRRDSCDSGTTTRKSIVGNEVLLIVDIWIEFLKHKEEIATLVESHDFDESDNIDKDELQGVLDDVKDDERIVRVEREVTEWIFAQADVDGKGFLSVMELARALSLYDMWAGNRARCPTHIEKAEVDNFDDDDDNVPDDSPAPMGPIKSSPAEWSTYSDQRRQVLEVLRQHSVDGDDRFELKEISSLLVQLGFSEEEGANLVKIIDKNRDAMISVDEFMNWVFSSDESATATLQKISPAPSQRSSCCTM